MDGWAQARGQRWFQGRSPMVIHLNAPVTAPAGMLSAAGVLAGYEHASKLKGELGQPA